MQAAAGLLAVLPATALAAQPTPWQMWSQPAATPTMARIDDLHGFLTWIMVGITVLVMGLLGFAMWRFHHRRNPVPSQRTHNTPLEIVWTVIPIAILLVVAVPSFNLLYYMDRTTEADMTVKVVGHQWYWSYEYPDHGGFGFTSFMKYPEELAPDEPRLLAVDQPLVLPVGVTVRLLLTASDVIHSWAVPALGVKSDTVPGRISETWVRIEAPGVYYGQCSELCGVNHGFMPIEVRAVPRDDFETWVESARAEFAHAAPPVPAAPAPGGPPPVALAAR
ncbi:cytochrome c oxidase subunit II [Roseospira goensis]|uniref:Cytochrome c oxidase subunit 2 n=1 Tax=Roseospira goensis TaxID=391922 RepID=A0A7W6WLS5_9PROT|nr:cytochrome c oxidase subunit II [Roseospira goensis]MBB4287174.1 cytochrome c oxidase subunit 2 [Roseospira goensis]